MNPAINIQSQPTPLMYVGTQAVVIGIIGDDAGQVVSDDAGTVVLDDQ